MAADDLEKAKQRLDDEYGQITRRFDEIHEAFDKVIQGKPGDDMYGRLKDLEKKVKRVRTGGLFRHGAHGYNRALRRFVSEVVYDGRLLPLEGLERQRVVGVGAGIRHVPVEHEGNSQASPEEADVIAAEIDRLVGLEYTPFRGAPRPLRYEDVMVVAPYNLQVRSLRARLPEAVRVGTVDKFQGQQAPVVFYSTASSSGTPRR